MRKSIVIGVALMLGACNPDGKTSGDEQIATVQTQMKIEDIASAAYRVRELAEAKNTLAIAKINAETETVRARAATEENRLIQASIADKTILQKQWTPAGANSTFASPSSSSVGYTSTGTSFCCAQSGNVCYNCVGSTRLPGQ